ncbi:MAG TPA: hypothetical protein VLT86_12975 [Vicinamibacterales bacterium]|nr:hypothetical protein [Vicinamibacterales bacterium]
MPHPFALQVPADDRYRALAPEVAGKYVELVGGTAADGRALAEALLGALGRVVNGHADVVDLKFESRGGSVHVDVRCGDQTAVVQHAIKRG